MKYLLILLSILVSYNTQAQKVNFPSRANLVFGIGQLTQGGFNVEGNVFYKCLAFDYSHGIGLKIKNSQLEKGNDKDQSLSIKLPWTTGFGLGYRFTDWLNLRVEPKWHRYELYHEGEEFKTTNPLGEYTTFTLGLGLYVNWAPFRKMNNFLKGIMIAPNVRWWPKVSSTLENDELVYDNKITGNQEVHKAREIGIANTAFFFNISIGYSIEF